jgi:hypothetical protein
MLTTQLQVRVFFLVETWEKGGGCFLGGVHSRL